MNCGKIGKLILKYRKEKNMTQKDLADKLNISDKTVSKWERGLGCPDISLLIPLSEVLEINIYELLGGEKMDKESQEKADKVIKETIESTSKVEKQNKLFKILFAIPLIMLILYIVFMLAIIFGNPYFLYNTMNKFSFIPENTQISTFIEYKSYLKENSCELSLENGHYPKGDEKCLELTATYGFVSKLPMYDVKDNKGGYSIDEDKGEFMLAYELTEDEINKYKMNKNYSKKAMIVDSLIIFNFISGIETVKFKFADNYYLIEKEKIEDMYLNKYVSLEKLVKSDNWNQYVINKLDDKDFIAGFFKEVEIVKLKKFGEY